MKPIWASKTFWTTFVIMAGIVGILWCERGPILSWYYVRQLAYAYQDDRDVYAARVASLGEAALPRLLTGLRDGDALVCGNMQLAIGLMAKNWGAKDARCLKMIENLHKQFPQFSLTGQEKTLALLSTLLQQNAGKTWPASATVGIGELMVAAEKKDELRTGALLLAAELLECVPAGQWVDATREMAERGLADSVEGTRVAAVQLLMRGPMRKEKELLAKVVSLLRDPEPAVRRVALVALASEKELVRADVLMAFLHDPDAEVQYLCVLALRNRNLSDDEILLARLISDQNPSTRMRVLHYFPQMPDLNLAEWLRRLSLDSSPAVRAAAVRVAGENPSVDLNDRLREMAEQDTSDTVRMNASYYLQQRMTQRALNDR